MLGTNDVPGIMALTITDIFDYSKRDIESEYNIIVTYVEIYNEAIRDLLVPHSSYLELRDDPIRVIIINRMKIKITYLFKGYNYFWSYRIKSRINRISYEYVNIG